MHKYINARICIFTYIQLAQSKSDITGSIRESTECPSFPYCANFLGLASPGDLCQNLASIANIYMVNGILYI